MAEPQDTIKKLSVSFDQKKGELSRYELAEARYVLQEAAAKAPDSTLFPWWIARVDSRLHFIDTGEFVPDPKRAPLTPAEKNANTVASVILGGLVLLVVGGCSVFFATRDDDDSSSSDGPDEIGASIVCEQFVEDRLRAPSTADFPSFTDYAITGGPNEYTVQGYVDAENGFGAMIRTDWTCTASSVDGDSWTLISLSGI